MAIAKRIFLFLVTNILVVITLSIVMSILGIGHYITSTGINYESLFVFCFIFGMGGSIISLLISRKIAKWMMRVQVIDPNNAGEFSELVQKVHNLAKAARLPAMPEVGIYESPEINAFATGPSKSRSLVAVSTGLLQRMNKDQVEGVLGHEIAHIANGDMVTLTLIQGVINTFVMFFARIAAFAVGQFMQGDDEEGAPSPWLHFFLVIAFEIMFAFLGAIVVSYFSRIREYRADAGGATLAGRDKMLSGLRALLNTTEYVDDQHASMASMKISGKAGKFANLFSTHPPLEERIRRLENMA